MENCIFCKIINGEIPSVKIWEDDKFIATLDIFPNTKGMTLVIPKQHHDSYVFDMADDFYCQFFIAAKKVARILETGLEVKRVALVMEGTGVDHAHLKLYPLHGVEEEFKETTTKDKIYFENYQGYLSTQHGPQADPADLQKLAEEIKNKNRS